MKVPTIAIDWDGTLVPHLYPEQPQVWLPGAVEALDELAARADVFVYSCRLNEAGPGHPDFEYVRHMLEREGLYHVRVPERPIQGKPLAHLYIDDRAVRYAGDWTETLIEAKGRL